MPGSCRTAFWWWPSTTQTQNSRVYASGGMRHENAETCGDTPAKSLESLAETCLRRRRRHAAKSLQSLETDAETETETSPYKEPLAARLTGSAASIEQVPSNRRP